MDNPALIHTKTNNDWRENNRVTKIAKIIDRPCSVVECHFHYVVCDVIGRWSSADAELSSVADDDTSHTCHSPFTS